MTPARGDAPSPGGALKVLFVDDDERFLRGLGRSLEDSDKVNASFVSNGASALLLLKSEPFDVVVSDIRMPGMTGVEFLEKVRNLYPQIARIVLTGQADQRSALKSVKVAHQFLAKPCEIDTILDAVGRAYALHSALTGHLLHELVTSIGTLPSVPRSYQAIVDELNQADPSMQRICTIVSSDIAMTVKLLQLVNSAFFGLPRHIEKPSEAAMLLGVDLLHALVLGVQAFESFDTSQASSFSLERFQRHSLAVAETARQLAVNEKLARAQCDTAFLAGMLHDIGTLVLVAGRYDLWVWSQEMAVKKAISVSDAEKMVMGTTHAELGGLLLSLWGLPADVVEAVLFHHWPGTGNPRWQKVSLIVMAAEAYVEHRMNTNPEMLEDDGAAAGLDSSGAELLHVVTCLEQPA